MSIISKETWDKFTQEEKEKIRRDYQVAIETGNGKVIYELENLLGKEALQPQPLTYEDVARELFKEGAWQILEGKYTPFYNNKDYTYSYRLNFTSSKQAEKLLALNKLMNVAKFLNGDWKPDWEKVQEDEERIYGIGIDPPNNNISVFQVNPDRISTEIVYFRTEELAEQAVQILGEDTVRLALGDY